MFSLSWIAENLYILSIAIVVILICALLIIIMPSKTTFFEVDKCFPELKSAINDENYKIIKEEYDAMLKNSLEIDNNECLEELIIYATNHDTNTDTNLFQHFPQTYELIKDIPDIVEIGFIDVFNKKEFPKKKLDKNSTVRAYFPLTLPGLNRSGTWVDGKTKYDKHEWNIFDASVCHTHFNEHQKLNRLIFYIDLTRPKFLPVGTFTSKVV